MVKPEDKPTRPAKKDTMVASKNRVFEALASYLDGVGDEEAQTVFLHSIGISNERDVAVLLRKANEDDAEDAEPVTPTA